MEVDKILHQRNLKVTKIRKDILSLFNGNSTAVSNSILNAQLDDHDRVTVYRTIQTLLQKGIIHEAFREGGDTYFALCPTSCSSHSHHHVHAHFKCEKCDSVTCVDLDEEVKITLPGYQVSKTEITATGICPNCL